MSRALIRTWAVIFVLLTACPFTTPFSTFEASGPHGMQSDSIGVASVKDLADQQPGLAAVPVTMFWFTYLQSIGSIAAPDPVVVGEFRLITLRI